MTVFDSSAKARTMNFNANDVGFIPAVAGHYIENLGDDDLVFLEMFKSSYYADVSLNQWTPRLPPLMVNQHLHLSASDLSHIPDQKSVILS
jgi:oxalate decarboxylase